MAVIEVRNDCAYSWRQLPPIIPEKVQKAIDVSNVFEPRFRLPIAINLAAVLKGELDVGIVARVFRAETSMVRV